MPFGVPVREQGVVRVSPDVPNDTYEQKRVTVTSPWTLTRVQYMEPPDGYYWVVDSMLVEATTDATVSTRDIYYYTRDKTGRQMRTRIARIGAAGTVWITLTPYASHKGYGEDASSGHGSDPLNVSVMQNGVAQGVGVFTAWEAGDTLNVHMFVREYKVR